MATSNRRYAGRQAHQSSISRITRQTGREPLDSSGLLPRSGGRGLIPVTGLAKPPSRRPRPSLRGHYSPFIATTPQSAPVRRIRYSRLRLSASAYSRSHRFRWGHDTIRSRVPDKSPHHVLAPFTPDTAWPRARQLARLIPGNASGPGSDVVIIPFFRRVIGRFAFAQLRGAYLTGVPLPFPATLKNPALNGRPLQRFGILSRRADPGGPGNGPSAPSSISCTALLCWLRRSHAASSLRILGTPGTARTVLATFYIVITFHSGHTLANEPWSYPLTSSFKMSSAAFASTVRIWASRARMPRSLPIHSW